MEDIAPELLKKIQEDFRRDIETSVRIKNVLDKLGAGEATYQDAQVYAEKIGQALARAFKYNISTETLPDGRMYYNIAERVLAPMLEESYDEVANVAVKVQQGLNKKAGLGLKAKRAALNEDRVKGIVDKVSNAESFEDVQWVLDAPVENFCLHVVDETLKTNVEIHAKAGLNPRIIRKAESNCCKWCSQLEGEYLYDEGTMPEDVFRRHERCRCLVTYDPADGSNRRQNVYTKKWTTAEELDKIEVRKKVGAKTLPADLAQHPKKLTSFTPASLRAALEADGFEVKALKKGKLKGTSFDDGGGFKVNFEDGGLIQYHPAKGSHHGGEYYKISTGKGGTKWYELDGTEKK